MRRTRQNKYMGAAKQNTHKRSNTKKEVKSHPPTPPTHAHTQHKTPQPSQAKPDQHRPNESKPTYQHEPKHTNKSCLVVDRSTGHNPQAPADAREIRFNSTQTHMTHRQARHEKKRQRMASTDNRYIFRSSVSTHTQQQQQPHKCL